MRILLSNDDGVHADGIQALCKVFGQDAEIVVVAPDRERSASSHGITLHRELYVEKTTVDGASLAYQTSGTPVDCVKWALATLQLDHPFDLMFSGINAGANLATDVLYSGTIAAAGEASLQGVPSIAFSLLGPPFDFDHAAKTAYDLYKTKLGTLDWPNDTFLSVNLPRVSSADKFMWTTLGVRKYHDEFLTDVDESGRQIYRYGGDIVDERGDGTVDVDVIQAGFVSITPIRYRFTNREFYSQVKS